MVLDANSLTNRVQVVPVALLHQSWAMAINNATTKAISNSQATRLRTAPLDLPVAAITDHTRPPAGAGRPGGLLTSSTLLVAKSI
eukprot:181689-Pyramimonas_sp.AAC.1